MFPHLGDRAHRRAVHEGLHRDRLSRRDLDQHPDAVRSVKSAPPFTRIDNTPATTPHRTAPHRQQTGEETKGQREEHAKRRAQGGERKEEHALAVKRFFFYRFDINTHVHACYHVSVSMALSDVGVDIVTRRTDRATATDYCSLPRGETVAIFRADPHAI